MAYDARLQLNALETVFNNLNSTDRALLSLEEVHYLINRPYRGESKKGFVVPWDYIVQNMVKAISAPNAEETRIEEKLLKLFIQETTYMYNQGRAEILLSIMMDLMDKKLAQNKDGAIVNNYYSAEGGLNIDMYFIVFEQMAVRFGAILRTTSFDNMIAYIYSKDNAKGYETMFNNILKMCFEHLCDINMLTHYLNKANVKEFVECINPKNPYFPYAEFKHRLESMISANERIDPLRNAAKTEYLKRVLSKM